MRLALAVTTAAALFLGLHAPSAQAQGRQDFTLVNRTGYTINELYVGPTSSDNWGPDILGTGTLPNGRQVAITFPARSSECMWDMKVVYDDGDQTEWRNVNLCSISRISLFWDRGAGTTRAVAE
jgi:hypothetical protein